MQVFNQYLEAGGEEIWVDTMGRLGAGLVEFHELRFHSRAWKGKGSPGIFRRIQWLGDNPAARKRLRDMVMIVCPDVLVFHNLIPVASFGLYDEAKQLGLPVIQYIHNFRPFSPSGTLWIQNRIDDRSLRGNMLPEIVARAWEKSWLKTSVLALNLFKLQRSGALNNISTWIAVSEFMRLKFIAAGIPANRIVTLHHCWDASGHEPAGHGDEHYLFLGRLVPEKGIYTLLDAWKKLEYKLGNQCPRLIIAGTGPEEARIHAMIATMSSVECVGYVTGERKAALLRECRALIAPSIWWEPLGLIVHETYQAGRPVIAAASGGLMETVIPGKTGFLYHPGDSTALMECVTRLEACGSEERKQLGMNGRRWLLTEAAPARWIVDFQRILSSTLATENMKPLDNSRDQQLAEMRAQPLVSILIPTYNREKLIEETIRSALSQTYENIEIVVVDNCSTDGTFNKLLELSKVDQRIRIFQNSSNVGPVRNWKRCIDEARGDLVKILWSDDLIEPTFVEEAVPAFERDHVAFVITEAIEFDDVTGHDINHRYRLGTSGDYPSHYLIRESLLFGDIPYSPGCAMFRTTDLKESLLVDIPNNLNADFSNLAIGNDLLIFLITASRYPKFHFIAKPLSRFRHHSGSITDSRPDRQLYYSASKAYFVENFPVDRATVLDFNSMLILVVTYLHKKKVACSYPASFYGKVADTQWSWWRIPFMLRRLIQRTRQQS